MPEPSSKDRNLHFETRAVHSGTARSAFQETSEAIFLTQSHAYDSAEQCEARFKKREDGFTYGRLGNPNVRMLENRIAALEEAEKARATATGMAAIVAALMGRLRCGDHVVASRSLFGATRNIFEIYLPRFGIETTLVAGVDLTEWKRAVRPNTKIFFLETPSNPSLEVIDVAAVADIAHESKAQLIVDNVFATSLWQKPLALGADGVVYSATKYIDGQGRCLGGAILGSQAFIDEGVENHLSWTGPTLSPFNAWILLKSLETFPIRLKRQAETAQEVAEWLEARQKISATRYPGLKSHPQADLIAKQMSGPTTVIAFRVGKNKADAFAFLNRLRLITIANNLGESKSLATHPASSTHHQFTEAEQNNMGVFSNLIRLSIGLEHPTDLIADLDAALLPL